MTAVGMLVSIYSKIPNKKWECQLAERDSCQDNRCSLVKLDSGRTLPNVFVFLH